MIYLSNVLVKKLHILAKTNICRISGCWLLIWNISVEA